jgi:hypothetical protein
MHKSFKTLVCYRLTILLFYIQLLLIIAIDELMKFKSLFAIIIITILVALGLGSAMVIKFSSDQEQSKPEFNIFYNVYNQTRRLAPSAQGAHIEYRCSITISLKNNLTLKDFSVKQWHYGEIMGTSPPNGKLASSYYSYSMTLKQYSSWDGREFTVNGTAVQWGTNYVPVCSITLIWDGGTQEISNKPASS